MWEEGKESEAEEEEEEEDMVVDVALEVDAGQLAAGRLRELCHHTGQGPVLSLQPLLSLPQGLNLLYLGEVLQGGGGGRRKEGKQKHRKR